MTIASNVAVTDLQLMVRDIDYNAVPTEPYSLGSHDITRSPVTLLIEPSAAIKQ